MQTGNCTILYIYLYIIEWLPFCLHRATWQPTRQNGLQKNIHSEFTCWSSPLGVWISGALVPTSAISSRCSCDSCAEVAEKGIWRFSSPLFLGSHKRPRAASAVRSRWRFGVASELLPGHPAVKGPHRSIDRNDFKCGFTNRPTNCYMTTITYLNATYVNHEQL